jgi:amidase
MGESMTDQWNALSVDIDLRAETGGELNRKTFVVKENIDVEGFLSQNGNPVWAASHRAASINAPAVDRLLAAGARLVGKAHMDEMAFSLFGDNHHFGTVLNPAAPDRYSGGSSSGSAAAVAAGIVDFALGTDTAGSCRAPAAFCGVYGFRPSHGAISSTGVVPLAVSLDTIGWFARDIETMIAVGDALLPADLCGEHFASALVLTESFSEIDSDFLDRVRANLTRAFSIHNIALRDEFWKTALTHFRNLQAFEAWRAHGEWIAASRPDFGPGVGARFEFASLITQQQKAEADAFRHSARTIIADLLGVTGVFVLPTVPFEPPLLTASAEELDAKRQRMVRFFLLASFFGLPQINIPARTQGAPTGLSFIGPRWSDRALLALAQRFDHGFGVGLAREEPAW